MENKVIEYYIRNVYGNDLVYIKDVEIAFAVTLLTKSKTLTPIHIAGLEKLGFTLQRVME